LTLERPLIVGARGGMGRRYTAILRKLGIEPLMMDLGDMVPKGYDSVIIATPTAMHAQHVLNFLPSNVPILCEKPLSTSLKQVNAICSVVDQKGAKLDMVNQYRYCAGEDSTFTDLTSYDYFNTGRDGLFWDCISIIALANDHALIKNESPIWSCVINGKQLRLSGMDWAYLKMIELWLAGDLKGHGTDYIRMAHKKVQTQIEGLF
jgi:hypothetical protein